MSETLKLRDYQKEGKDFMVDQRRVLLADQMGLGKTLTTLQAVKELSGYPTLVIAPKVALYVWKEELEKWFDMPSCVYSGKPKNRKMEYARFCDYNIPVLITNYAFAGEVLNLGTKWRTLICDEIHKAGLLNRKTKTFKRVKSIAKKTNNVFLLTGTPMRNTPADLWGPLHLLNPKRFSSYWRYVHSYCVVIEERFGKDIERRPQDAKELRKLLSNYMVRHRKTDVLDELPEKVRQPVHVDMSSLQRRMYTEILEDMATQTDEGILVTPNVVSQILRLRQILTTPRMFGEDDRGGALKALAELVQDEFDQGNTAAVFTPFRQAVPYISEELENIGAKIFRVTGAMSAKELDGQIRQFQKKQKHSVLICVIKSGASFTAHSTPAGFFVGAEWSVIDNLQAEDRLHRLGQKDTVRIHYLLHRNTVDDMVMEQLNAKQMAISKVIKPERVLKTLREGDYRG